MMASRVMNPAARLTTDSTASEKRLTESVSREAPNLRAMVRIEAPMDSQAYLRIPADISVVPDIEEI